MSQRIPENFIDDLVARTDIVELIGSRVRLKAAGREHKGLCPFHDEKTPSFTVSPGKGFYHCFGCGAHGTAVGFLMNYDNLEFPEAVEALADRLGIEVPRDANATAPPAGAGLIALLGEADQLYRQVLRESPVAINYLQQRGIDGPTATEFGIGYAPDAWDTVLRAIGNTDAKTAQLIEAGLVIRNDQGRCYDRFRGRIMFPIRDTRGNVIGFGGRILDKGEPKYLNSPETPVFHKGRALYGLHEARRQPGRPDEMLVVEGYLDVVSLAQHGIKSAVATLGTATTTEHVRQLARLTDRVIFCFDGDRAGRAAAWRAMETALPLAGGSLEIQFLLLPSGEDPDSLVRTQGAQALQGKAGEALPLSEFMVRELCERTDTSHADGRAKLAALAQPLVAKLPRGSVYGDLLVTALAEQIGLEPARVGALIERETDRNNRPTPSRDEDNSRAPVGRASPAQTKQPGERKSPRIRYAIKLIVHYPAIARDAEPIPGLNEVTRPGAALLRQLIEIVQSNPQIGTTAQLLERFRGHEHERALQQLAMSSPLDDEVAATSVLGDNLALIVQDHERRQRGELLRNRKKPPLNMN